MWISVIPIIEHFQGESVIITPNTEQYTAQSNCRALLQKTLHTLHNAFQISIRLGNMETDKASSARGWLYKKSGFYLTWQELRMGRNPQEEALLRDQGRTHFLFPHVAGRSNNHHGIVTLLEAARGIRD